jgi:hypothetical protein
VKGSKLLASFFVTLLEIRHIFKWRQGTLHYGCKFHYIREVMAVATSYIDIWELGTSFVRSCANKCKHLASNWVYSPHRAQGSWKSNFYVILYVLCRLQADVVLASTNPSRPTQTGWYKVRAHDSLSISEWISLSARRGSARSIDDRHLITDFEPY